MSARALHAACARTVSLVILAFRARLRLVALVLAVVLLRRKTRLFLGEYRTHRWPREAPPPSCLMTSTWTTRAASAGAGAGAAAAKLRAAALCVLHAAASGAGELPATAAVGELPAVALPPLLLNFVGSLGPPCPLPPNIISAREARRKFWKDQDQISRAQLRPDAPETRLLPLAVFGGRPDQVGVGRES